MRPTIRSYSMLGVADFKGWYTKWAGGMKCMNCDVQSMQERDCMYRFIFAMTLWKQYVDRVRSEWLRTLVLDNGISVIFAGYPACILSHTCIAGGPSLARWRDWIEFADLQEIGSDKMHVVECLNYNYN